ncbi:MAG: hypothetical protein ACREQ5_11410, partial [Candidatus Dormibacteria bacterium]
SGRDPAVSPLAGGFDLRQRGAVKSMDPASGDCAAQTPVRGHQAEFIDCRQTSNPRQLTGQEFHPWAEVVTIIGFLDGPRDDAGSDRFTTEEALARAVAKLGAAS